MAPRAAVTRAPLRQDCLEERRPQKRPGKRGRRSHEPWLSSHRAGLVCLAQSPFAPPHCLAPELAISEGRDDEPALAEGGIGLGVAVAAQGNQPVEVEVRAPLGALGDMMDVEASPDAARLADPGGAGQDLGPNLAPGLETG